MALVNLLRPDLPLTTRVQKIILRLSEYICPIEHQRLKANVIADVLSRKFFVPRCRERHGLAQNQLDPRSRSGYTQPIIRHLRRGRPSALLWPPAATRTCRDKGATHQRFKARKDTPQRTKATQNRTKTDRTPDIRPCPTTVMLIAPILRCR